MRKNTMYISTGEQLAELVQLLKNEDVVAIDTEFMREKTYYARLCLIQIGYDDGEAAIIDPLAIGDLSPLEDILYDERIVKIFHAGGQDLEIFYQLFGKPVCPVFDTQNAASLLGYREQIGYGALVSGEFDIHLSKADSFTDWARRPLSDAQISYAKDDVVYLVKLYPTMREKLEKIDRLAWLDEDFAQKCNPSTYEIDYDHLYRRVKKFKSLNRRALGVAQQVAIWREREAQRRNLPKRWIVSDETLIELARRAPKDIEAIKMIRGYSPIMVKEGKGLIEAIACGLSIPESELPVLSHNERSTQDVSASVDLMTALVRQRAKDNNISTTILASHAMLEKLVESPDSENEVKQGWRKSMVGDELTDLLEGKLSLSLEGPNLEVRRIENNTEE